MVWVITIVVLAHTDVVALLVRPPVPVSGLTKLVEDGNVLLIRDIKNTNVTQRIVKM